MVKASVLLFQSDRCIWSKRFIPVWNKLKKELLIDGIEIEFIKYDVGNKDHMKYFSENKINGYPNTCIVLDVDDEKRSYNVLKGFLKFEDENGRQGALNKLKFMINKIANFSKEEWENFQLDELRKEEEMRKRKMIWGTKCMMKYLQQAHIKDDYLKFAEEFIKK